MRLECRNVDLISDLNRMGKRRECVMQDGAGSIDGGNSVGKGSGKDCEAGGRVMGCYVSSRRGEW